MACAPCDKKRHKTIVNLRDSCEYWPRQTVCMHVTMTSYRFILLHMIIVSIVFQLLINGFHTRTLNQHETELNPTLLQGIDTKSFNLSRLNKELISFSFRLRHLFTSDLQFSHSLLQSVWSIV